MRLLNVHPRYMPDVTRAQSRTRKTIGAIISDAVAGDEYARCDTEGGVALVSRVGTEQLGGESNGVHNVSVVVDLEKARATLYFSFWMGGDTFPLSKR